MQTSEMKQDHWLETKGETLTVRELVAGEVIAIGPQETLREAAMRMSSNDIGALAVMVGKTFEGILTERDIVSACADDVDLQEAFVDEWMTAYPDTVAPDTSIEKAATWMTVAGYRHLPVLEDGKTLGVVSIKDILWALTAHLVT